MKSITDQNLSVNSFPSKQWMVRRFVYGEVLDALDSVFTTAATEYMPIKGAHLICTGLDQEMAERRMLDLDILVRPGAFRRTVEYLEAHPLFRRQADDPWPFEQPFIYLHGSHNIRIELHNAINRPERFSLDVDLMFDRAKLQTTVRRIMSVEDALTVLICHTLVHLVDGSIRSQAFEEAALLAHQEEFSWERFASILDATGIGLFGKAFCTLAATSRDFTIPARLKAPAWAVALLRIKTPGRSKGLRTALFRAAIELPFVKDPLALSRGFFREWR